MFFYIKVFLKSFVASILYINILVYGYINIIYGEKEALGLVIYLWIYLKMSHKWFNLYLFYYYLVREHSDEKMMEIELKQFKFIKKFLYLFLGGFLSITYINWELYLRDHSYPLAFMFVCLGIYSWVLSSIVHHKTLKVIQTADLEEYKNEYYSFEHLIMYKRFYKAYKKTLLQKLGWS